MTDTDELNPIIPLGEISFNKEPTIDADPIPNEAKNVEDKPKRGSRRQSAVAEPRNVGRPSNEAVKSEELSLLTEDIEGFMFLVGFGLKMRDTHTDGSSCGDLFMDLNERGEIVASPSTANFAKAMANVAIDNRYLKAFFSSSGGANKYVALATAVMPFVKGMAEIHGMPSRRGINVDVTDSYS